MHPEMILKQFQCLSQHYMEEMKKYTWEDFNRKPSAASWSLGEMYTHVIETGYLQMKSLLACLEVPENHALKKTFAGKVVYFIGGIPPIKAKVPPSAEGTAYPPSSREELIKKMNVLEQQMEQALPIVMGASPDRKIEHPYFGYINAREWYYHILMHVKHHLRQKKRIDSFLNNR
ncbi:hypothetical protein FHS18_002147 [Paenibacillus phyllosphaerae]|uniref:DinB-like domain-containing protein n=1 Tax=Paenibacillus phyllosphaerae TaxID=274593 RepID=A0A7W5FMA0_9BACL|nr:DinB family protein [Paenibacillus phyllosphaerae]MBB3110080.1 hypothetical protein [Paenibacillus phyllosphaerae]